MPRTVNGTGHHPISSHLKSYADKDKDLLDLVWANQGPDIVGDQLAEPFVCRAFFLNSSAPTGKANHWGHVHTI